MEALFSGIKKVFVLFLFMPVCFSIKAQVPAGNDTRGGKVISQNPEDTGRGETYAIIMGVSQYKNIPSLKYADADAKLFRDLLLSPAGGNVKPENIIMLLNDSAKMADFLSGAKGWLKSKDLKAHDRLYLYFSGHGDADEGNYYFLTYDCAPEGDEKNYSIGGAINMHYIKTMFIKPQIDKKVEVIIIMDACRTNELPGGKEGQLYFANRLNTEEALGQIMFFATGPGQVSIESSTIFGGHGLFTFYLVDGLAGQADKDPFTGNQNGEVSFSELESYVKGYVRKKATSEFSSSQEPFICCSPNKFSAKVDDPTYTAWEKKTTKDQNPFAMNTKSMGIKGPGDWSINDSSQIKIYNRFVKAIKDTKSIVDWSADSLYEELEKNWPGHSLTQKARYSLATSYLNFCQEKINLFLSGKGIVHIINMEKEAVKENSNSPSASFSGTGEEEINKLKALVNTDYIVADSIMKKAFELLKNEPELLESFRPRYYFLNTMAAYADKTNDLRNVLQLCRKTIETDSVSPSGYLLMGWILNDMGNDSCEYYFRKAATIAPKWPYPVNGLGNYYFSEHDYDSALMYFNKAIRLDSLNNDAYRNIGLIHYTLSGMNSNKSIGMSFFRQNEFDSAKYSFVRALKIDPCDSYANEYLGKANQDHIIPTSSGIQKTDSIWFNIAKNKYLKSIACDSNFAPGYESLSALYSLIKKEDSAIAVLQSCITKNPKNADGYRNLGNYFKANGDAVNAIANFRMAISLEPATGINYFSLARLYRKQQNKPKAIEIYKEALNSIGNNKDLSNEIGNTYFDSPDSQPDSAIVYYKKALEIDSTSDYVNYNIGQVYLSMNSNAENDSSVYYFGQAVRYNYFRWNKQIPVIADYYYNKKDYSHALPFYKQSVADSLTRSSAINRLIECYIQEKNFDDAKNAVNRYIIPGNQKELYDRLMADINAAIEKNNPKGVPRN